MTKKLFIQAIIKFTLGVILVGLLVFLPAGTPDFFGGLLFMAILFIPMFFAGIVMMVKNPALLKSRLDAKEKQKEQDKVVKLSGLMFLVGFIMAGLNFRFDWFVLPKSVSVIAAVIFLIAYILYAEVLRENTYLSRTVQVQENQKVIDTGTLRYCQTSYVQRYPAFVSCYASRFRFSYFFCYLSLLSSDNS